MDSAVATFIACFIVLFFIALQIIFFIGNKRKLNVVKNFFQKKGEYSVFGNAEDSQIHYWIAEKGSNLWNLITELNAYTKKNHGTTDFSVIQNKTERKIEVLYEEATSKLAFPVYIGLMGTFLGVAIGLLFFNHGLSNSVDGISDEAIGNLIKGVLISMVTSFTGLLLSTISNYYASEVRKKVDQEKSSFFEFIQNELMPTLGVSIVAALNKLHHTINLFEPSFTRVIDRFESTFDKCTERFGNAFEQNVRTVSEAVEVMGENMDKINDNVDLQAQLLKTLRSRGVVESLDAFVGAAANFQRVTIALNQFEAARNSIANATEALIQTHKSYTKSLEIPLSVANKLNGILVRVADFENSIHGLGKSIKSTQLFGNYEIELVKEQLTAIKKKQKIAMQYIDISDGRLKDIFDLQDEAIRQLNKKFEEGLAGYAEKFENVLEQMGKELQTRRAEIVAAIEEKFSLEQIQQEFAQLHKLDHIEKLLGSIDTKASREEVEKSLQATRDEVKSIRKTLDSLVEEAKKKPKSSDEKGGGIFSFLGGRK